MTGADPVLKGLVMAKTTKQKILDGDLSAPFPSNTVKMTLAEIQVAYDTFCSLAGELQYKILCSQEQLKEYNLRMKCLNEEASKLKPKDKK